MDIINSYQEASLNSKNAMHYLYELHVQQTKAQQLNLGDVHGEVCMTKPQQTSTQHCAIEH